MNSIKISILGTEYDIEPSEAHDDCKLTNTNGYLDYSIKTIRYENNYNKNDPMRIDDIDKHIQEVKRHEIIHAYLYESGVTEWAENEMFVDWITTQFPKMLKTFQETKCI